MKDLRNEIQKEALKAWIKAGKKGTLEISTGVGKTKISLDAAKLFPKNAKILFLAETTQREQDLREDQKKFRCKSWNIQFMCYQSAYKLKDTKWDLVIADEIHEGLTLIRSKFFFNNKIGAIIGLSATVDKYAPIDRSDPECMINKGDLLKDIAPVCYKYTLNDSIENETTRDLEVYIIHHSLDRTAKNIQGGNKKTTFMTTEYSSYQYLDERFRKAMFLPQSQKSWAIPLWARKRADLLYSLPSKVKAIHKLLGALNLKTIVFGNHIDSLLEITPFTVSSRNKDAENDQIRSDFDSDKIKTIGSFKMLKQGANLKDLDACVIHSYYSKELDIIQRLGRLRYKDKKGYVFIFVTTGTQETVWFKKMTENLDSLTLIPCLDVEDAIKKFKSSRKS
jgi:superfamily II DNA or RNA helicase